MIYTLYIGVAGDDESRSDTGSNKASTLGADDVAQLVDVLDDSDTQSVTSSTAETVTYSDLDDFDFELHELH